MQDQLDLMGFESEPQSLHTLFFAITLPPDTGMQVAALREKLIEKHRLNGTLIGMQHLHVTLLDLELFGDHKVDIARQAAESVAAASLPTNFVFDRVLSFSASKAVVLAGNSDGGVALATLRQSLEVAMRKLGLRAKPVKTPHLTLMYSGQTVQEHPVEPIQWSIKEFTLIRSHVGKTLHEPLGSWPLCG